MPKDSIYGPASEFQTSLPTFTGDRERFEDRTWRVDVSWGRDTTVELATMTFEGLGIRTIDPESPDGLWVTLDRLAINSLIRTLRKARDQAYGPDE